MPVAIPSKRALVLNLRDPSKVTASLPKYQFIQEAGSSYLAVPHTVDVWHVLKNLGVNVENYEPMRWYYPYPKLYGRYDPMPHQSETSVFCTANKRCFILNEMRTGKSASVLWAGDYLRKAKQVKRTLILCTMSCMDRVWRQAIFGLFPDRTVAVLHGSHEQRLALLKQDFDYFILNHDGLKVGYGNKKAGGFHAELVAMAKSGKLNLIIMDEGSEFRNASTDRWKALKAITVHVNRIWWLTGTPTPGGPEDAWAQCMIVNPSRVPSYFTAWRDKVMYQVTKYKWAVKDGHDKLVHEALQPAVRYKKSEVLDMMPVTYEDREAALTDEQLAAYRNIKAQGVLASKSGAVTAVNAAVLLGKMLQIGAGAVRNDEGGIVEYTPTPRLRALDEIIEQSNAKVIVFAPYKAIVDMLVAHVSKKHTVAFIDGRVTGRKRNDIIQAFQDQHDPVVLVAHPKTTGHGLELSAADTVVWFAPMHSVDLYEQANNRIMSGLQKCSMGVYHIGCTTLEWRIYKALRAGVNMQQEMLKLYDEEILGKAWTNELTSVKL
jgi:SNF2 family DNA or RNA helicase